MATELEYQTRSYAVVEKRKNQWNMFCYVVVRMKKQELLSVMLDSLSDIFESVKSNQKLDITESLLWAPYGQSNCLSRREDIHCKEALFKFIASIDKQI